MIRKPLDDPALEARLQSLETDGITVFTLGSPDGPSGGELRGVLAHGSRLVNEMRANHGLGPLETLVLGQAYLAVALISAGLNGDDSVSLRLDCDGPARGFSVEARVTEGASGGMPSSEIRGYLFEDNFQLEEPLSKLDMAPLLGAGSLTQTRFIAGSPRPFSGGVSLKTGRLAEDLASYFLESEQVRSAVALGIHFSPEGWAEGAGGLFLQALPGATESFLERAEGALTSMPSLGRRFAEGAERAALLASTFGHLGLELRGERDARFFCRCSRERFASFLRSSEGELLDDLIANGPWPAEAVCHNCATTYIFPKEELESWRKAEKDAKTSQ